MSIDLTPEQITLRDNIRRFMKAEVVPLIDRHEAERSFPFELLPKLAQFGYLGGTLSEADGGMGLDYVTWAMLMEEAGYHWLSLRTLCNITNGSINRLATHGSPDQKERFLKPALRGELKVCTGLTEPDTGSNIAGIQMRAELKGDHWVLNGRKLWITNAGEAGLFLIFANVDPEKGYRGITAFLVERGDPGFTVGKRESKLGIRASSTCELLLDDCAIPLDRVLGEEGRGYKIAIEILNEGRIGIGAQMVGVAAAALDAARQYTLERAQFGRKISEFQAVQHQLARCAIELEAARLLVYNAARLRDAGQPFIKEAAMAKLYASEAAEHITSAALELHGGYGYTTEYLPEKLYRDAKIGKIYEGTSFMQLNTIAKLLLGE
jgi:butyryl-CoA dehydrogenase/short/branched chain acyl-CoA dehydrogenase